MRAGTKKKRSLKKRGPSIERWTVERLDRDAGMARIEAVLMLAERVAPIFERLTRQGLETGMDSLSLWDVERIRTVRISITRLSTKLGLRKDEKDTLSENMVFWLINSGKKQKPTAIYHATGLARKTTKDLYTRVSERKGAAS